MIIAILIFLIIFFGVWVYKLDNDDRYWGDNTIQALTAIFSGMALIISIVVICVNAIKADYNVQQNKIKYDSLVQRLEIVNTEYEDVSKSDVIKDVAEWNAMVNSQKYWNDNILIGVYFNNKVVENLEYIEINEKDGK